MYGVGNTKNLDHKCGSITLKMCVCGEGVKHLYGFCHYVKMFHREKNRRGNVTHIQVEMEMDFRIS